MVVSERTGAREEFKRETRSSLASLELPLYQQNYLLRRTSVGPSIPALLASARELERRQRHLALVAARMPPGQSLLENALLSTPSNEASSNDSGDPSSSFSVRSSGDHQSSHQASARRHLNSHRLRTSTDSFHRRGLSVSSRRSRDPDIPEYQYNPFDFRPSELTLRQACRVMSTFDIDNFYDMIKDNLCRYSLRIYGLEECAIEDLRIAVFLFVEQHFSFQPGIEFCVRSIPDPTSSEVVGAVFERNTTVDRIIENRSVLNSTRYQVALNFHAGWIIWNYDD